VELRRWNKEKHQAVLWNYYEICHLRQKKRQKDKDNMKHREAKSEQTTEGYNSYNCLKFQSKFVMLQALLNFTGLSPEVVT
jgi:predicted ATP-binding protein involved in virulence